MFTTKKGMLAASIAVALATPVHATGIQSFLDALRNFESESIQRLRIFTYKTLIIPYTPMRR
ncbi:hypothetical protein [Vibrio navarrensis]|uniref:hypothetical protein n=1 Tax=Vibrio navarrensis TaxID=29495 RepID=UPI001EE4DE77|nr:hypothetical protein [Vibrio navarrensis]